MNKGVVITGIKKLEKKNQERTKETEIMGTWIKIKAEI